MRIFAIGTKIFGGGGCAPRPQRRTAPGLYIGHLVSCQPYPSLGRIVHVFYDKTSSRVRLLRHRPVKNVANDKHVV